MAELLRLQELLGNRRLVEAALDIGCGAALGSPPKLPTDSFGTRSTRGSAHLTTLPFGMEASPPLEDQSFRLAPCTTMPDDEGTAAADGSELFCGVPTMCRGSGGLLALVFL